ncbi:MAG TPA: hypothetical protein VGA73_01745 [Candidatus Binatia bacterium]
MPPTPEASARGAGAPGLPIAPRLAAGPRAGGAGVLAAVPGAVLAAERAPEKAADGLNDPNWPAGARLNGAGGGMRPLGGFVRKTGAGLCCGMRAGAVEGLGEGAPVLPPPAAGRPGRGTIDRAIVRIITASG